MTTPTPTPPSASPGVPARAGAEKRKTQRTRLSRLATVLTILGLLAFGAVAAVVVRQFLDRPSEEESKVDAARRLLRHYADGVGQFLDEKGRLPDSIPEVREVAPEFDAEPWDAWRHPIEYRIVDAMARTFRLRSYGPDGKPDSPDDVVHPPGDTWR